MPVKKTARTRLIEERKRRQWSQQELADHLGTTRHNVSRWEAGLTTPGPYFRTKLCELFAMSARELGLLDSNPSSGEAEKAGESTGGLSAETLALWTVPYLRNPHFTGREELLDQLDQQFAVSGDNQLAPPRQAALTQPQAIKGLGGIGKTQIAVEYAYRAHEQGRYAHILWISAASEEAIIASFVALAGLLPAGAASSETNQRKLVAAVIRWLEQRKERWLLIFDNADALALVQEYLPQQGHGSILLTTRANAVGALAASIEVEKMGFVEGTHLLLRRAQRFVHASDEEINEAGNLAIALDHFPLALDQAAAYIEETGCNFSTYLQLYQDHRKALLARRGRQNAHYPDSVATTWSLSFQKVEQANPAAAELLRLCAFLAPDGIPEEILTHGAAYWPPMLQRAVADPFLFNQVIEDVLTFSLIKRLTNDHLLSIHRLVQAVIMDTMGMEEQRLWVKRVIQAVNEAFPRKVTATTWSQCQRYLSQAQQCTLWIEEYVCVFEEAASLLFRTASYLHDRSLYPQAEALFQQARTIWEQVWGPDHPDVAASLFWLAIVYVRQAKYEQAELLHQRALSIREQVLGPEHLDVAASLYRLAVVYAEQEKDEQAEPLLQRALQIWEQKQGAEHLDIAGVLDALAIIYTRHGKDRQAEELFQRALSIRERVLGSHHPDVAASLNNLSSFFLDQGNDEQAESLGRRALQIWEQALGPEHSYVAYPLSNLAELYAKQGKYAQSEAFYLRVLRIWERSLGPEHPEVAVPLNGLAGLYREQGKYEQAESLYQRALHVREQSLGPEHPLVAPLLNGLANLYTKQGRFAQAELLFQRVLSIREQTLGEHHLETAETLHDFAELQETQGRQQEALSLYQRALTAREQVLGETHPATIATRTKYRALLHSTGRTEEAVAIRGTAREEASS
ncbi:MAG TPA: FxSxx-COOH system tetratricopeptide repeat protein [Ktedonosporobacter sp.]|jgi:tetratricopeptide (TPR) repeat protein/transcriptional regulator with XRE-family HTH domain|nr:FxSxx-COOH system tetratricopeptide repeat protein [Ktedonosporobacter sp.]